MAPNKDIQNTHSSPNCAPPRFQPAHHDQRHKRIGTSSGSFRTGNFVPRQTGPRVKPSRIRRSMGVRFVSRPGVSAFAFARSPFERSPHGTPILRLVDWDGCAAFWVLAFRSVPSAYLFRPARWRPSRFAPSLIGPSGTMHPPSHKTLPSRKSPNRRTANGERGRVERDVRASFDGRRNSKTVTGPYEHCV